MTNRNSHLVFTTGWLIYNNVNVNCLQGFTEFLSNSP